MRVDVPLVDDRARALAESHQQVLTKPRGSLGVLEELACHLAGLQGTEFPQSRPAAAVLFAADHPVTQHGVAPYPDTVTAAMVRNFLSGGAAASVLCRKLDVPLTVVDVGVRHRYDVPSDVPVHWWREADIADEVGDLVSQDAMSQQTFTRCLEAGRSAVGGLPADCRVLVLGEMGIGNTTVASAVAAALLDEPAEQLVGPGTGASGEILERKRRVVRDAVARIGKQPPLEVLRRVGGRELAALVGAAARAVERGTVVLVDGFIVTAALFALVQHEPRVRDYLVFAHRSGEPGHTRLLSMLGARPLLDLGLRLGEGSGALLALPLLDMACSLHTNMATFEGAQVPDRDEAS